MSGGAFSRTMITVLAVVMLVATASGKDSPQESGIANPLVARAMQYAFPDETRPTGTYDRSIPPMSLGVAGVATASPGVKIGDTWYDQQQNGSMGRMIDWGWDASEGFIIHFSFNNLDWYPSTENEYAYNCYYGKYGSQLGETGVQPSDESGGGVGIDVTDDNRAVLGGHNNQGSGTQPHFYWDYAPGVAYFSANRRVDDSVAACVTGEPVEPFLWPKFRYQDIAGNPPVLHVLAHATGPGSAMTLVYFRKVGIDDAGTWDYCPYMVDTVFNISHDVACSMTDGKIALVWTANLPNEGDCDTCSGVSDIHVQMDNDIYYQVSHDYGASFNPRVNLTKNVDGEAGFRPYTDLSALITQDETNGVNALHIGWSGRVWPADAGSGGFVGLNCRMFHWGQNLGNNGFDGGGDPQWDNAIIRTAGNLDWHQTTCNGGAWQMNGSKMSISECNSKLYYLWVQFNDPNIMMDDCAERGMTGEDVIGSANGELYLAVSDDGGLMWDLPRNLTNSHTPYCDSALGVMGACNSDHWASMARFGTNIVGSNMSGAQIVTPTGGYDDGWYLDVQYIDDQDPGSVVQDEGTWQNSDVKWFRLACVDPLSSPTLDPSYTEIDYPTWTKHGVQLDTTLTIENNGNVALSYFLSVEEDLGPAGWLSTSGLSAGSIPAGVGNSVTGDVIINSGGIVNSPGTIIYLSGRLIFNSTAPSSPDTFVVNAWVADTLIVPEWDTVYAGGEYDACLALLVGSNGNMGGKGNSAFFYNPDPVKRQSGDGSSDAPGQVNMDFFNYGDCDTEDSIPGATEVYLFDASPVICWDDGGEIRCNWSIFGDGYLSENGFLPLARWPVDDSGFCDLHHSEFMTRDTGIKINNYIFAPKTGHPDSCHFLLQKLRFTVLDGETHTGLTIGEAIDWDIPSDSGVRNNSGYDAGSRLIYQQGREYHQDDDVACQDNDWRYGGMAMTEMWENGSFTENFHGAYTMDNSSQVYPTQGFDPEELYTNMANNEDYVISDSTEADLHSVMTFKNDYSLTPEDTLEVFVCLVTGKDGLTEFETSTDACLQWYDDHIRPEPHYVCGDVNNSGDVYLDDLTYLVTYLFNDGPAPPIMEAADLDGFPGVNVADLSYLVKFLFGGGPPPSCGKEISRSAQSGGHVYLDDVDGLYNSSRYIRAGEPITFHIRVSNVIGTKGADIAGLTNGFRIYSPTGTPISVNTAASTSSFEDSTSLDGGRYINSFGTDGDSTGFGAYAQSGAGVPDGLDMVAYTITLDPIDAGYRGSEICLDSTWYPPCNEWIWATGSEIYVPDWGGPYCFTVVDPVDLVANFTATPTAGDVSTVFQFYSDTTGAPDWWDWDFGDGQHSSEQNPIHQYVNPGRYDVTLTVRNTVEESAPHKKLEFIQVRNILWSDLYAEVNINAWGSRPGYDIWYWCSFHNAGNLPAGNCTLKVLLPSEMAFQGIRDSSGAGISPGQYFFVGDTIVMPLGTIEPSNDWNRIVPYGILSPQVTPGVDSLVTEMWLSTSTTDGNSRNDYVRHAQVVTDPSKSGTRATYSADKSASPNGTNLAYAVEPDQRLSYTVAFENAAAATAPISSIEIVDTLDANLDWSSSSLSIGEMSHPNACTFVGFDCLTGELTWFCNKINLPPNTTPPNGEGYITYSANPDQGLVSGAEIINIAYLKFGFDDPIPVPGTNGLYRRIGDCCIPPIRGDINYDNETLIDIADLVYLVDYMFNQGPAPVCFEESDVNGSGGGVLSIDDLVYLVDFMFSQDPPPVSCP